MSTVTFKDAYLDLLPGFERASGHRARTQSAPTVEVLRRIRAGETVDLALMAQSGIDEPAREGKIVAGSELPFVQSDVGGARRRVGGGALGGGHLCHQPR